MPMQTTLQDQGTLHPWHSTQTCLMDRRRFWLCLLAARFFQ
jgi:hypothetical protein